MANIKVAVRVRPISARELKLTGSEVVIRTDSNEICLTNLKVSSSKAGDSRERTRKYGFDYCFDSSDPEAENFADQRRIYQTLGETVLDAVFSGYNSCLVAYGQSASGKTYTMMGSKEDPGLTPRLCEGLFARIEEERKNERSYRVSVSYLEIYNERVRDLLKPSSSTSGLRVREHPRLGPYVQGLTQHVVRNLGSLMSYVEEGSKARKTASTSQNPSSSRSHALLTIAVAEDAQSVANGGSSVARRNDILQRGASKLRLVDLAGSESAATCSGVHRLKEGANINKSLVALGNVISALAERGSTGSGPGRRFIPYRDSSLTWLLKDALGGNATTIMLATISPASGSYNETAHTLRFAQRAQSVVNRPVVNEDPVARIIRELRAEVVRLRSLLEEKSTGADAKALCCCQKGEPGPIEAGDQSSEEETERESTRQSAEQNPAVKSQEEQPESRVEEGKRPRSLVPLRRSNSSDSVTTCELGSPVKKFGSAEFLTARDRFAGNYNRAKVTELNDDEDEINEIHESVFVDIPTLVAVLIKPDDNLQGSSVQIEEICSDEPIEFIERGHEAFDEPEKQDSIDHDERSSSVNSYHASGDNEAEVYKNAECPEARSVLKPKEKPKFRKQDSVDVLPVSVLSNLHTSKKFGSVETIQRKKDPPFCLERSHTNLERRSTTAVPDKLKKLNNIREIDDQRASSRGNWRASHEQLQRKGSNDSDKSSKESNSQSGSRGKNYARKPSLENLKRKTSKDSSSSSSKDEQILISSLARDKLARRKSSLEQEPPSTRNHTPIQKVKRAEIVAAVTERLYSSRKPLEDTSGLRSPPEGGDAKSLARMKLQEISRKMLGKRRRVCVDTQTDSSRTIRMKDIATLTDTPQIIYQDVGVLTDHYEVCEHVANQRTPVLRVKEIATLTEKPKTNIVRCKDVASLANDLEEYDYEIHSPRNDSGILSDDTQNYAESNLSSTEAFDFCQGIDKRRAYAESSTNTSIFSSCRSFAVQTPRLDSTDRFEAQNKTQNCVRHCCKSIQSSLSHSSSKSPEKSVISISLPDAISIVIESASTLEPRIAIVDNDTPGQNLKPLAKDEGVQTDEWNDLRNDVPCSREGARSTPSQTDSRVFRIENIFQDPNNVAKNPRVDTDRAEGTSIRNSITLRNSLGTSYVSQAREGEHQPKGLRAQGFIRDGLITEAFISRRRGFNFRKAPSSVVYQDPWRNWQVPVALANASHRVDCRKGLETVPSSWQPTINEVPVDNQSRSRRSRVLENVPVFKESLVESRLVSSDETSEMKSTSCNSSTLTSIMDYDYGFSDDSLDYNENNVDSGSKGLFKTKMATEERENLCPPDVVAHTKKDPEKIESVNDFEDGQVEFPKKTPTISMDTKVHDYKSLIMGTPFYKYEEANDESDAPSNCVNNSVKKKVSFSSSNISERRLDQSQTDLKQDLAKLTLKSIIKEKKKKTVCEPMNSSNDETDDSQQEEKVSSISEDDWKVNARSTSSEQSRGDQDLAMPVEDSKQDRKVKFPMEELLENACSESDSCENVDADEEEGAPFDSTSRNVLEEYLSEAVTFMRNLNTINEYVNGTSTLDRYLVSPCHGPGAKRGSHRRICSPTWNRDCSEYTSRKANRKREDDSKLQNSTEDVDVEVPMESYARCLKGIERLEDCIRRVDTHNELLREKYGVNCESAGARSSLASPSTDFRVPITSHEHEALGISLENGPTVREQRKEDDLEKKIFDQLMNVANSISLRNSNKYQTRVTNLSDSVPKTPSSYTKFREKHNYATKDPFCGGVCGSFSLEETSDGNDDHQDFTTYEITGNLSVGRSTSIEDSNDDLDTAVEEEFLPLRRFNHRSPWSANADRAATPSRTIGRESSTNYGSLSKYDAIDSRTADYGSSGKLCNSKGNIPSRVSTGNSRGWFQETDDCSRRIRDGSGRVCAWSRDRSEVEGASSEMVHLRDKLKYPGSPRARFLELLRERRRIVECSRGASAF
ncbi:uncharacterized protein LOC143425915 [Xylocopa sonorina]|uniref:uncharacterized protein LOC143425915 n=1 Tax=Xylocopa sonorina TaxID=1818115 RepID=UPI00403AD695